MSVFDDHSGGCAAPPAAVADGVAQLRLVFAPVPRLDGVLDGGWWPRTANPSEELPALFAAVARRFGVVARVSLSATVWDAAPEQIASGDQVVVVAWFRARDSHTIRLLGRGFGRLDLLVIPPGMATEKAAAVLALAAGGHTIATLQAVLTAASPACSAPAPRAVGQSIHLSAVGPRTSRSRSRRRPMITFAAWTAGLSPRRRR